MVDPSTVIQSDPEILGGAAVFRGTRVPVRILFELLSAGDSLDELLDAYPLRVPGFRQLPCSKPAAIGC